MISSTDGADGVVGRELRILVADHLIGPVEQLHPVLLRHAHQPGDGLQRQFARHLLDEVAASPRRAAAAAISRARSARSARSCLDGARREGPRDDLAQMGVVRGVHVRAVRTCRSRSGALDGAVGVARQRGLLQAGEHVTAPRDLLDVLVLGHHPEAAVVEAAHCRAVARSTRSGRPCASGRVRRSAAARRRCRGR